MAQQMETFSQEMETLSHVLRMVEAFRAFDSDNDGVVTEAELGGIMGSLGYNPSEQDVKAMMQRGDTNGDGLLSINEFLEMNTRELGLGSLAACLRSAFESLDSEGVDVVTGELLYEVMEELGTGSLSLECCADIIASVDGDGDGAISFEDFKLILNSLL
ncbi:hypothetical protein NMG60_11035720 [Bertholletia excelsa]